jgi:predicted transcriptional regulator
VSERRRRDSTEITYYILKAAIGGQKKTRIMYQSGLNLKQLNLYLRGLETSELLGYQAAGKLYFTTEKGRTFAKAFEHFRETRDLLKEQEEALSRLLATEAKSGSVPSGTLAGDAGITPRKHNY